MAPSCGCKDTALLAHRDAGGGAVHSIMNGHASCLRWRVNANLQALAGADTMALTTTGF